MSLPPPPHQGLPPLCSPGTGGLLLLFEEEEEEEKFEAPHQREEALTGEGGGSTWPSRGSGIVLGFFHEEMALEVSG